MLSKKEIKEALNKHLHEFSVLGVNKVGLFGSYVRDEQKKESDIDLLLEFNAANETFDNYIRVCAILENLFPLTRVDIVTGNGLSPYIGPYILKEVEYV